MQDHRDDHALDYTNDAAVRRERLLPVSAEDAWALVRDADGLSTWLADEVDLLVAPGERGTVRDGDGPSREVLVEEIVPGRRLSLRWWTEDGEPALVDLTLDETARGTRFVVTEIPLRLVAVPDAVPAQWTPTGGQGTTGGAPQMLAVACR